MKHRMVEGWIPESMDHLSRYQIAVHYEETRRPLGGAVVVVRDKTDNAAGFAFCSPEDTFDIRVGVPLALKRALHQIKKCNRKEVMRAFFQAWPEAHPAHRQPYFTSYTLKEGDPVTRLTVQRGVTARCPRSIVDESGRDVRIHCPSCVTVTAGEVIKVPKVEEVPDVPPTEPPLYCRNCECALEDTHKFCHQCGVRRNARS